MNMYSPLAPTFNGSAGSCIRAARKLKGWSLDRLAEALGVSKTSVWGWETDKIRPRTSRLREIAELLELPPEYVLNGKPSVDHTSRDGRDLIESCQLRIAEAFGVAPIDVEIKVSFRCVAA